MSNCTILATDFVNLICISTKVWRNRIIYIHYHRINTEILHSFFSFWVLNNHEFYFSPQLETVYIRHIFVCPHFHVSNHFSSMSIPKPESLKFKSLTELHIAMVKTHPTVHMFRDFKVALFHCKSSLVNHILSSIGFSFIQKTGIPRKRNTTLKTGPNFWAWLIVQICHSTVLLTHTFSDTNGTTGTHTLRGVLACWGVL